MVDQSTMSDMLEGKDFGRKEDELSLKYVEL